MSQIRTLAKRSHDRVDGGWAGVFFT